MSRKQLIVEDPSLDEDDDDRTTVTIIQQKSEYEIDAMITGETRSYTEKTTAAKLASMKALVTVASFTALSNSKVSNLVDENGRKVYDSLNNLLKQLGPTVQQLIHSNYNLLKRKEEQQTLRLDSQNALNEAQGESLLQLIPPSEKINEMKLLVKMSDFEESSTFISATAEDKEQLYATTERAYKLEFAKAHLKAHAEYETNVEKRNDAINNKLNLEKESVQFICDELFTTGLIELIALIVSKLKGHVSSHSTLVQTLKNTVILSNVKKTEILNPFDNNNLPGLYAILQQEFHNSSLSGFSSLLINTINQQITEEESNSNPMKAVQCMEEYLEIWTSKEAFAQLTPDHLFTAVLIKSLHPDSEMRRLLTREINRIMRENVGKEVNYNSMSNFNHAKQFIKNEMENKKMTSSDIGKSSPVSHSSTNAWSQNSRYRNRTGTTEQAAMSELKEEGHAQDEEAMQSTTSAHQQPSTNKQWPGSLGVPVTKIFTGPVNRPGQKYYNTTASAGGGKVFDYKAVLKQEDLCPACYGNPSNPKNCNNVKVKSSGKCYANQCNKCSYYGHPGAFCMQKFNTQGAPSSA